MDSETKVRMVDQYPNFAALADATIEETDYRITVVARPASTVAVIAPHGGSIERRTSAIARAIAGDDFNLYLFEGLDASGSFEDLHITSHRFDEPACLAVIADCDDVIAVHGYAGAGLQVLLGGLDRGLIESIAAALAPIGVEVLTDGHAYPGEHRRNICNRGRLGRGVQLELSDALRGSSEETQVVDAIRHMLLER
jgi:phage replication-related protein YjqB (UPF0714/DUF867 family)